MKKCVDGAIICPECGADLREAAEHMKGVMGKCTEPADTSKIGKRGLVGNSMMHSLRIV